MQMKIATVTLIAALAATAAGSGGPAQAAIPASSLQPRTGASSPASFLLTGVSCASAVSCTAVGAAYYSDPHSPAGSQAPVAMRWNGKTWALQHAPNPTRDDGSTLAAVSCPGPGDCVAVGDHGGYGNDGTLAEAWNGKTWVTQPTPLSHGIITGLDGVSCTSPAACTAVGYRSTAAGHLLTLSMSWNGKAWVTQHTPNPPGDSNQLFGVSCTSARACTAVGSSAAGALAMRWNGKSWSVQHTVEPPGGPGFLAGVSCDSGTHCVAAGNNNANEGAGPSIHTVAEVWNGTTWALQPTPNPARHDAAFLNGVSCVSGQACAAAGWYASSAGTLTSADRWNGRRWALQASPNGG
jgi:hypothetical protein